MPIFDIPEIESRQDRLNRLRRNREFEFLEAKSGRMPGDMSILSGPNVSSVNVIPQGAASGAPTGGQPVSVVEQLLKGPTMKAEGAASGAPTAGLAPSAWGGTMRPIALPAGTSLLDVRAPMTGVENDPVLAERKAEFDRNLPDFLRKPFQTREEFERGIAQLPGAGAEILGHVQQRAAENMPTTMRREWEQSEANRLATMKTLTEASANEAAYQNFLKTATPDQVKQFHESNERTPEGWKPVRMMPWEKAIAAEAAFKQRATPEEWAKYKENYMATPSGSRMNPALMFNPMLQAQNLANLEATRRGGGPPAQGAMRGGEAPTGGQGFEATGTMRTERKLVSEPAAAGQARLAPDGFPPSTPRKTGSIQAGNRVVTTGSSIQPKRIYNFDDGIYLAPDGKYRYAATGEEDLVGDATKHPELIQSGPPPKLYQSEQEARSAGHKSGDIVYIVDYVVHRVRPARLH